MSALVFFDARGYRDRTVTGGAEIGKILHEFGLGFGRWDVRELGDGSLKAIQATYGQEISQLEPHFSLLSADRVTLRPDDSRWPALREQFRLEHTHVDAEIRFFLAGRGLFYVRADSGHLALLCTAGDWVYIPAGTPHFFDAGSQADFDALRLFSVQEGWAAQLTGVDVSPVLPDFDAFCCGLDQLSAEGAGLS